jgi:hypothetical protein
LKSASRRTLSPAAEWSARVALLVVALLVAFMAMELAARVWRGGIQSLVHWPNRLVQRQAQFDQQVESRFIRDPQLGYAPRPNYRSPQFNHDAQGMRVTDPPPGIAETPLLLATGDSYTYGDEVADAETWPAALQRLVRRRTINAGVNGYGLDQSVLRTEAVAPAIHPAAIVLSFVADDLTRAEMEHLWGAEKPYFTLATDGSAVLRNVPVPDNPAERTHWSVWQRAFGWSMVIDTIASRLESDGAWSIGNVRATTAGTGAKLACPLMQRLARLNLPTMVVAQYEPGVWGGNATYREEEHRLSQHVLDCAKSAGFATLDTFDLLENAVNAEGVKVIYVDQHPSGKGNEQIAQAIATELARRKMLPE